MNIALAQIDLALGDITTNVGKACSYIRQAAVMGADLVVLPELWSTGYDLHRGSAHATRTQAEVVPMLAQLALENHIHIVGSLLSEEEPGKIYNTAIWMGPTGQELGRYSKLHLFRLMQEHHFLAPGRNTPIIPFSPCLAALAICYDLRFPELFRKYALAGVSLVIISAEWPSTRIEHWRTLIRARAIENQCYIAACNRTGVSDGTQFGGCSMIVDPWGIVAVEGGETEQIISASIDFNHTAEIRARIPVFQDRRPDIYAQPE